MRSIIILVAFVSLLAGTSVAGIPDMAMSHAEIPEGPVPRFLMVLPDGSGPALHDAAVEGGQTWDATITLTLLDAAGDPVFLYPFEDLWLWDEDGTLSFCTGGSLADHSTDESGQTAFSNPPYGGGYNRPGNPVNVWVAGAPLEQPGLPVHFNSPDVSGDLLINLSDITLFVVALGVGYDWACDFNHDGLLNLTDIVEMAQALGLGCP